MKETIYAGLVGLALGGGALAVAWALSGPADPTPLWQLSRSAGLVAYTLLWGSVCWGLLLSSRLGGQLARPPVVMDAHQYLSQVALGFALFHSLALTGGHLGLAPAELLLPLGPWQPLLALGQLAFSLSALVLLSAGLRRQLGNLWWRRLHYVAFLAFGAAAAHGLLLGSSTGRPEIRAFYFLTVGMVLLLTLYRVLAAREERCHGRRVHPAR